MEYLLDQAKVLSLKAGLVVLLLISLTNVVVHEWNVLMPSQPPSPLTPPKEFREPVQPARVEFIPVKF